MDDLASVQRGRCHIGNSLAVITPVGPGHEGIVEGAKESVIKAGLGDFSSVEHIVIDDRNGILGRSRARNIGIELSQADWLFFLDADDLMMPYALSLNDFEYAATFGAIFLDGLIHHPNVYPCTFQHIAMRGALGTLAMGFFCRRDVAADLRWNEEMDAGEDYEFYLRLPSFTKKPKPLVDIGYKLPSAHGPRGYEIIDWTVICNREIARAVQRDPNKFGLRGDAVLAPA